MRKIETPEIIEAKAKTRKRVLTIIILVILLGSTAGYAFISFDRQDSGNGQEQDASGKWTIDINGQKIYLTNSRDDVANISINTGKTIRDFSDKPLYISSESDLAYREVGYPLSAYASRVQEACYGKCDKDLPEKNCTDNLIVFRQNDTEMVSEEKNCIFISGTLKSVDAFIYDLFS